MSDKNVSDKKSKIMKTVAVFMIILAIAIVFVIVILFKQDSSNEKESAKISRAEITADMDEQEIYKAILTEYYGAIFAHDGEILYQRMAPPEYWEYYKSNYSKSDIDIKSSFEENAISTVTEWRADYGEDVQVSFSVDGKSDLTEEFLTQWENEMNSMTGENTLDAEKAVTLSVKQVLKGSQGTVETTTRPTLILVNGEWYILDDGTTVTTE